MIVIPHRFQQFFEVTFLLMETKSRSVRTAHVDHEEICHVFENLYSAWKISYHISWEFIRAQVDPKRAFSVMKWMANIFQGSLMTNAWKSVA